MCVTLGIAGKLYGKISMATASLCNFSNVMISLLVMSLCHDIARDILAIRVNSMVVYHSLAAIPRVLQVSGDLAILKTNMMCPRSL